MACGTGKTLVGLWVAEYLEPKRVLILVPSLALLRQTLNEWTHETRWQNVAFLAVCSDPSVKGDDVIQMRAADMDFPVSTDPKTVRQFLKTRYSGVKVIFSTYQSSHIVAEGMSKSAIFDLGIFDEAHKTAGKQGTRYNFALTNDNIHIRNRLFMTATSRQYNVRRVNKEGDLQALFSMDQPETYGNICYRLNFAEAAKLNIICDYKVLISVITTEMVNDALLSKGEVLIKHDLIRARQVATQLAIQQAVEKYGPSKIITFHRLVSAAKSYATDTSEGLKSHLPSFDTFHVNGSMPTNLREKHMKAFRQSQKAAITNASCLTEGVDIPVVDMVVFVAPKKSRIDIVQATGRAMRLAPGKTNGYVLIPLFVEQERGETVEEAVKRTDFEEVWSVLQAMQDQDEEIAQIITQMQRDRGTAGGYDESKFRDKVDIISDDINLSLLRDSITASIVERLGSSWDFRYGELLDYRNRFGHCNVPATWSENENLGTWCQHQRSRNKSGQMGSQRKQLLDSIDFIWDIKEAKWMKMYQLLSQYRSEHGNSQVPVEWPENSDLGGWVSSQRYAQTTGNLSTKRIDLLNTLDFVWDVTALFWTKMYAKLKRYQEDHGDCNVPHSWKPNPQLASWVNTRKD
jgi:predicted helicase